MACKKMDDKKENLQGSYGEEEMATVLFYSQKFGNDLMQNCDLPPPMKVYAGQEKTIVSPMNNICTNNMIVEQKDEGSFGVEMSNKNNSSEDERLELLKALRLSQTRAREAERKVAVLSKEKNDLGNLLLQQSMELFAYKQWLRMVEFQVSTQDKHKKDRPRTEPEPEPVYGESNWVEYNEAQGMTLLVAVAICMSIAGVGLLRFFSSSYH